MPTSAAADRFLSLAVSRKTYVPAAENVAVVLSAAAFANVTVPGPLTLDHVVWSVVLGTQSTGVAVPETLTPAGSIVDESALAVTASGVFTVTATSSVAIAALSSA